MAEAKKSKTGLYVAIAAVVVIVAVIIGVVVARAITGTVALRRVLLA